MHTFQFGSSKEDVLQAIPERKIKKLTAGEKRLAVLRIGSSSMSLMPNAHIAGQT